MDRKRLSGAGYRTKAKEKAKKQAEVLTKTKTLQNYFSVPLPTSTTGKRLATDSAVLENHDESNIILPTDDPVPVDGEYEVINNENRCVQQIRVLEVLENHDGSNIILPTDDPVPVDGEYEVINNENRCVQQIHGLEVLENLDESNIVLPTDDPVSVIDVECEAINNENRCLQQIHSPAVSVNSSDNIVDQFKAPSDDPALWIVNDVTRDTISSCGVLQNIEKLDFSNSKRICNNVIRGKKKVHFRYCTNKLFFTILINGEKIQRDYLVYSQSTGTIFCIPCKLFGANSAFATTGYSDWKRAGNRIASHEQSLAHKSNVLTMKSRGALTNRIDTELLSQINDEVDYWKNVLKRVVVVVKTLAIRGLAFRGNSEKIGCPHNEVTLSGREHFIVMTYFFILDNLQSELQKRKSAYDDLVKKFSFFHNIIQHSNNEIRKSAKELCEAYPNDLNISLASEVVQLQGHIHSLGTSGNNPQTILELMLWIRSNNFIILYPYVEIALRIFLSTASTNCSAERSFSVLKRVKNYLRSTMNQERCSALALLTIESDITRETDFEEMIILFSNLQSRRKL